MECRICFRHTSVLEGDLCNICRKIIVTRCDFCGELMEAIYIEALEEYRCEKCEGKELVYACPPKIS